MWASVGCLALLFPLIANLRSCYKAILNDARIISRDPALQSNFEVLYAYPGGCLESSGMMMSRDGRGVCDCS